MDIFEMTRGDKKQEPECQITAANGDPVPITGWTIRLNYNKKGTRVSKLHVVVDEALGKFKFIWDSIDVDTEGTFKAQIEIDDGSGKTETWPTFYLRFKEEI